MTNPQQPFMLTGKPQKSLLRHLGFARGVCWLLLFSTCFSMLSLEWPLMITLKKKGGVRIVFHPDAKLIGDRRKMTFETLVSDLEYVADMALMSNNGVIWK